MITLIILTVYLIGLFIAALFEAYRCKHSGKIVWPYFKIDKVIFWFAFIIFYILRFLVNQIRRLMEFIIEDPKNA